MEKLSRIEAHLKGLDELSELVGALRSMAATRTREAQDALDGTRRYCAIVTRAIRDISPLAAPPAPAPGDDGAAAALLVITADNGFVGGFNDRLIETALAARRPDERLIVVGRRGQMAAAERHVEPDAQFAMASRGDGVATLAWRLGKRLAHTASARIVYARSAGGAKYEIELRQVLPLDVPRRGAAAAALDAPLHHLPPGELLEGLASEHLFAEIANALMESLASENGARLRTMDAAAHNIEDRLTRLAREARAARQEETTSELLEVVTGAEAVRRR